MYQPLLAITKHHYWPSLTLISQPCLVNHGETSSFLELRLVIIHLIAPPGGSQQLQQAQAVAMRFLRVNDLLGKCEALRVMAGVLGDDPDRSHPRTNNGQPRGLTASNR